MVSNNTSVMTHIIDYLYTQRTTIEDLYDSYDRHRVQTMQKNGSVMYSLDDVLAQYGV
jgi:hypothetical protein